MNLSGTIDKIGLYILSMSLLFVFIIILSVNIPTLDSTYTTAKILKVIIKSNIVSIVSFVFILIGVIFFYRFKNHASFSSLDTFKIESCQSEDYEQLTFLSTYIAPFLGFTFDDAQKNAAYFALIIVIGLIIIKTDKYYANPTLSLFNYKLYRVKYSHASVNQQKDTIVISVDKLAVGDVVNYRFFDEKFCIVRKAHGRC